MSRSHVLVFASGSKKGGGSGFQELVENSRTGILKAEIVGVVSNHKNGGVRKRADTLEIPFHHMSEPYDETEYRAALDRFQPEFISLSGWLKLFPASCLEDRVVFNIHPGPLPEFGGKGMYGHHVHEAVIAAFKRGEITHSAVTMHFVDAEYDRGRIFFQYPVLIRPNDTPETLAERVNKIEHAWQSHITNLVVTQQIRLDSHVLVMPEHIPYPADNKR